MNGDHERHDNSTSGSHGPTWDEVMSNVGDVTAAGLSDPETLRQILYTLLDGIDARISALEERSIPQA